MTPSTHQAQDNPHHPDSPDALLTALWQAKQAAHVQAQTDILKTAELIRCTAELIHLMQLERGRSMMWLASHGQEGQAALRTQQQATRTLKQTWERAVIRLSAQDQAAPHWSALYVRLALAHQGLTQLLAGQAPIMACQLTAHDVRQRYSQWIQLCLDIVAEASNGASDLTFTRATAAWLQGMQAKELAGQERALGTLIWTQRHISAAQQAELLALQDEQQRCLSAFVDLSPQPSTDAGAWPNLTSAPSPQLIQMRRWLNSSHPTQPLVQGQAERWFEACTERMNALYALEQGAQQWLWRWLEQPQGQPHAACPDDWPTAWPTPTGEAASHHWIQTLSEQARALQATADELHWVRQKLAERPAIEKAKALLMQTGMNEGDAHAHLRQQAMQQQRKMADVAVDLLSTPKAALISDKGHNAGASQAPKR